jgi:hypothetical protein
MWPVLSEAYVKFWILRILENGDNPRQKFKKHAIESVYWPT